MVVLTQQTDWRTEQKKSHEELFLKDGDNLDLQLNDDVEVHFKEKEAEENSTDDPLSFKVKIVHTVLIFGAFLGFSCCRCLYGPTLLELQLITGATFDEISMVFTCLGAGGIVGSLLFGYFVDRSNPLLLFVLLLVPLGIVTFIIPWCQNLILMLGMCTFQAACFSGLSVGANVMIFRVWREKAGPYILTMHLLYTVGGLLTPLISEPFLSGVHSRASSMAYNETHFPPLGENKDEDSAPMSFTLSSNGQANWNISGYEDYTHNGVEAATLETVNSGTTSSYTAQSLSTVTTNTGNKTEGSYLDLPEDDATTDIHYVYSIIGIYIEIMAVLIIALLVYQRKNKMINKKQTLITKKYDNVPRWSHKATLTLYALVVLFNICFGGKEMMYSGLIFAFSVKTIDLNKPAASILVSSLFAAYFVGRFSCIFLVRCLRPFTILVIEITLALGGAIMLSLLVHYHPVILWISNIITGLGSSAIFCLTLVWAEGYTNISGRFTSAYVTAYTIGMMTWPALTGYLYRNMHPKWFPHLNTILMVGTAFAFLGLALLFKYHKRWLIVADPEESKSFEDVGKGRLQVMKQARYFSSFQSLHSLNTF